jgi:hypothetical protein
MADQASAPAPSPGEFALGDVLDAIEADAQASEGDATDEGSGTGGGETEPEAPAPGKGKAAKGGKAAAPAKPPAKAGKAEPETPETPKEREKRHGDGKLRDDLSDDRPWTPERIKNAVEDAKGLQRHAQRMWATEQSRASKLQAQRTEHLREVEQFRVDRDHFNAQQRLINAKLASTDPAEIINVLGLLTGRDGAEVLEELNVTLARGGKKREPTRLEREQAARLEALEKREKAREEAARRAREDQLVAQRKQELAQVVLDNADEYPELALYDAEEIGEALAEIKTRRYNQKRPVSDVQAARILEADLQRQQREREARAGAPQGASGLAPRAQRAKPEQAQSSPPQRGRSLTQVATQERVSTRELDDDENSDDAADFLPANLLAAAQPNRW